MTSLVTVLGVACVVSVAAACAIGLVYQALGLARDRRRFPPPGVMVDVGGHRLHACIMGQGGPVVVLESGLGASSINWAHVQPAVATFTRVVSYDRAGYAWSEPARPPRTAARCADELHALLNAAGLPSPYVLVGHSFGGLIVRSYVARHRADVAALVFIDTTFPEDWTAMPAERRRLVRGGILFARLGGWLACVGVVRACLALLVAGSTNVPRAVAGSFGRTASRLLTRMVGEVQKMPVALWPAIQAHWSNPKCFESLASHLAHLSESAADAAAAGAFGDLPVVVVSAGKAPPEVARRHRELALRSRRGRHAVASGPGHWVHLDEPALVVAAIRECMQEIVRHRET